MSVRKKKFVDEWYEIIVSETKSVKKNVHTTGKYLMETTLSSYKNNKKAPVLITLKR